jgi:hypothetical protein
MWSRKRILLMVFSLSLASFSQQDEHRIADLRGSISGGNVYTNPALGMTINLPGDWHLLEITSETPSDPGCTGPLCGAPDVNAVLESKPESNPRYRLYLSGWKLSAQYLDRKHYPLKWFAGIMLEGSLGDGLIPLEKTTAIGIDGKPAFRLLAAKRGEATPRILGYVAEGKGYVFLAVCAVPTNPGLMQSAIEAMKLR